MGEGLVIRIIAIREAHFSLLHLPCINMEGLLLKTFAIHFVCLFLYVVNLPLLES